MLNNNPSTVNALSAPEFVTTILTKAPTMTTAQRILSELKQGFALSDQDLAGRLDLPEPSIRRTRLVLYRERKIEYGGRSCGQDAWLLKNVDTRMELK